jgi:glycosyltransferase involved in cell wall biosynthesis
LEHLVVDGGSTDGTLDILREFPHVRWISEKDEGHYHAMNKGIAMTSAEIVGVLNADDCYREGALLAVGEAFAAHPTWDAAFGDVVFVDKDGKEIFRREEVKWDYNMLRYGVCYVVHPSLFVRKRTYDSLGVYHNRDYLNCCDYDFILRMGANHCVVGHIPTWLVNYRFHPYGQSADLRVERNTQREVRLIRKAYGVPGGFLGMVLNIYARAKRQLLKVLYRGRLDLVPGRWLLRSHMRERSTFSSNAGVDRLE